MDAFNQVHFEAQMNFLENHTLLSCHSRWKGFYLVALLLALFNNIDNLISWTTLISIIANELMFACVIYVMYLFFKPIAQYKQKYSKLKLYVIYFASLVSLWFVGDFNSNNLSPSYRYITLHLLMSIIFGLVMASLMFMGLNENLKKYLNEQKSILK